VSLVVARGMTRTMDPADGLVVARLFHHLGDLFTEMAASDDPRLAESLAEQAIDAIRTIDEVLAGEDRSEMIAAARERARWQ
jgi:hypothetical protein